MSASIRPRRSVLYMPGSSSRALEKARSLPVDGIIMDLEDAVAPQAKATARDAVIAAITDGDYGSRELVIRINGLDTPWGHADLAAAASCSAHAAVLLPKIDNAEQVRTCIRQLREAGATDELRVWLMAETPSGILNISDIAAADPAVETIVMGTSDLAKALRVPPDPQRTGLIHALSGCVIAARAHGLDILDGVFADLADDSGFRHACEQGKTLGFDGKTLVHPRQIDAANAVFGVSNDELERAEAIVAAWTKAAERGQGIAVLDGQMIEQLHADAAQRTLALAAAIRNRNQE
ncbi:MAG TPA: CoA ester lyase [Chromatiales bacterium]|nr:CoA ester lyase [Chromatiales bacterium]